jgi:hypothetical protein
VENCQTVVNCACVTGRGHALYDFRLYLAMGVAAGREYGLNSVAELARRARKAGHLRPDFVLDDLILVLMANDGIRATSPAVRVAASRRFAALAIQAFRASPEASALSATPV